MTEHEPYDEPDAEVDDYPDDWTPKQKMNWDEHCQELYNELETDLGREWFRRTWRPKMRNDGYMLRDHVKFGTPEDYVQYMVDDKLDMWKDLTGAMMREMNRYENKDELEEAVNDIVQAKISLMSHEQQVQLANDAAKVAKSYGII